MHVCRRLLSIFACTMAIGAAPSGTPVDAPTAAVATFAEPAISPDGSEIAFVSGGDVWSVPAAGGDAQLLVATGGNAARPIYSPDAKRLAFVNSRPGDAGIYVVNLDGGALTRLTHDDVTPELDAWSADCRYVYFTTSAHNIAYDGDVMRVPLAGGTPMRVIGERYVNAMMAAPSPDGRTVAYVRNGFVQWWRRGHSHMDEDEIVLAHPGGHRFESLTSGDAKDRWPMWSPDGARLYFVSDRSGSDELWSRTAGGTLRRLTTLAGEPVLWPAISRDGRTIAFEHAMEIWTYDIGSGSAHRVPITLRGGPATPAAAHVTAVNGFSALALSPDGKKLAFVARGRVFAASSAGDAPSQLVTKNPATAADLPVWSKDSRHLFYVVDRGTEQAIATIELPDGHERMLTPAGHHDDYPHASPDGLHLAFVRDGRELHVLDLATQTDRFVARGELDRRPFGDLGDIAFSPASDWIAYITTHHGFTNVHVVRVSGGETHAVSFLPNVNTGPLVWAPDGTRLFFVTSQRTEAGQVAQIDLVPRAPHFREDTYRRLFETEPARNELPSHTVPTPLPSTSPRPQPSSAPATHATAIDFAGIRERLSFLDTGLDVGGVVATPDGKTLVLTANAASEQNLYAFSVDDASDEPPVARQLTSTLGEKSNAALTPDGKTLFFLQAGSIFGVGLDGTKLKRAAVAAEFDVDFVREKGLIFAQAWSSLDRWYADPRFHGVDWNAVERMYEPHALGAQNPGELRRVISLMLGELNSSHLGIRGPRTPGAVSPPTGRLGVQWDSAAYERDGRLRIAEIAPLGPLALAGGVHVGDDVLAVDDTNVGPTTDIDALLAGHVGKRTTVRIAPHGDASAARTVAVLPVDTSTESNLWYRAWLNARRSYVDRISGGRLGYVHLFDMSEDSLHRFSTELDVQNRAKNGVIVDVRNNEGGFVDPYAIDVLTRRAYAHFDSRFGSDASERTELGQRSLEKPTALVVNEHSLSDAENFTEAYRALHAGPVVGVPTAGWIIFTSATSLVDGSTLRLPSTLVLTHDGVDMELHPRPVDIRVDNPPGSTDGGDDPQLAAAVRALLRISANSRPAPAVGGNRPT
jgi:Tol biopolymer transport system component